MSVQVLNLGAFLFLAEPLKLKEQNFKSVKVALVFSIVQLL